eukprot:70211-Prorocentrum_minimum.AAC.1
MNKRHRRVSEPSDPRTAGHRTVDVDVDIATTERHLDSNDAHGSRGGSRDRFDDSANWRIRIRSVRFGCDRGSLTSIGDRSSTCNRLFPLTRSH